MGTYALDGVPLDDPAGRWVVSDETKLGGLPAPALSAVQIPGRHGSVPIPPSAREAGSHTVGLLVTDNGPDGKPTGDHQQLRANVSALWALAAPIGHLPTLRYYPSGNPAATLWNEAAVRLLAAVEPELHDPFTASLVLPFDLPAVFWRENTEHTLESASASTWGPTPSQLAGTTGTITDPVFLCAGPLTAVTVTDAATGQTMTWAGAVATGQWLRLSPADMTAHRTTAEAWTGGTDVSGGLSTGPGGFSLNPNPAREVGWSLVRSGGAGVNKSRVRRAFL